MKTTLELPEVLLKEVERRALQVGRDLNDEVADLLRAGLSATDPSPRPPGAPASPRVGTDPQTGLPVIRGEPGAPISTMSADEMHALIQRLQEEEDLERLGLSLRR